MVLPSTVSSIDIYAFENCPKLRALYFYGNAPSVVATAFSGSRNAVAWYLPGKSGWGTNFGGIRTALWLPVIEARDPSFGIQSNRFGFNVAWASGQGMVVEACSNLASGAWIPISTNTMPGDCFYVNDPAWTSFSRRFYRIRAL